MAAIRKRVLQFTKMASKIKQNFRRKDRMQYYLQIIFRLL